MTGKKREGTVKPNSRIIIAGVTLIAASLLSGGSPGSDQPQFNSKDELLFPADYREWVFLSSGLGMTYDSGAKADEDPHFDNVFAAPFAYKAFLETGRWPEHTVLMLEVRGSVSKGSINKAGRYQGDLVGMEAEVKDEHRFGTKWAFFSFDKPGVAGRQRPVTESCYACHAEHGAVDNTFVQFYPTLLEVARQKGTLR
jgi:hypothetical protein